MSELLLAFKWTVWTCGYSLSHSLLNCRSVFNTVWQINLCSHIMSLFLSYCRLAVSIRDGEFFICATFMYTSFTWPPSGHILDGVKLCFIINLRLFYSTWPWTEPQAVWLLFLPRSSSEPDFLFPVRAALLWLMDPLSFSVWRCRFFKGTICYTFFVKKKFHFKC